MKKGINFLRVLMLVFVPVLVGLASSCKKETKDDNPSPSGPAANEVWMQNTAFTPASITVAVNTTVTWINKDGIAHTVTSTSGLFNSGNINSNGTFSFQFTTVGSYPYTCTLHPGMTGTVIVQ